MKLRRRREIKKNRNGGRSRHKVIRLNSKKKKLFIFFFGKGRGVNLLNFKRHFLTPRKRERGGGIRNMMVTVQSHPIILTRKERRNFATDSFFLPSCLLPSPLKIFLPPCGLRSRSLPQPTKVRERGGSNLAFWRVNESERVWCGSLGRGRSGRVFLTCKKEICEIASVRIYRKKRERDVEE